METKHTPGPWHRNINAGGKYPTVWAGRNTHVAHAAQIRDNPEETEANISLIAAAPELLEALEGCIHHDNALKPEYTIPASLRSQIEAAIARAKGEA